MGGKETRITTDGGIYRYGPVWSPDNKKLLYWDKAHQLWYVDIDDKKPVLVDKGDYGDLADGGWSPNSHWIAYSKTHGSGSKDVFLYGMHTKKITEASGRFYNDKNPSSDPDGKNLIFLFTPDFH